MLPFFYPDTETTIVSWVVGNLINWLLHGVLTVQLYLYYLAFPNDKKWAKAAVYTVYILETVQAIGFAIILSFVIVSGTPDSSSQPFPFSYGMTAYFTWHAQAGLIPLFSGLVPLIAQCIYAHRIQIITRRKIMPGLIITLAILQFLVAIVTTMTPISTTSVMVLMLWSGLNVVNDLIIAFIMVRTLSKNKPLVDHTRLKVIRLMHLIIATGSLTVAANFLSFFSLLGFLKYYPSKSDLIAMPILVFMPKLYANSILVMLNNRMAIRSSRNATPSLMSTNVVNMVVIADDQIEPCSSAMSRDKMSFSCSATTSAI